MKKTYKIIIIVVSIIIVITIISLIVMGIIKNNREMEKEINYIKETYSDLTDDVKEYNEIRNKYSEMSKEIILDDYKDKISDYESLLTTYNNIIERIDKNIDKISSKCNRLYNDSDVNSICNNYAKTYEKLINLYVGDINNYNNNVTKYNEYKEDSLSLFKLIHNDYIDYNKDGNYEGRFDSNEEEK